MITVQWNYLRKCFSHIVMFAFSIKINNLFLSERKIKLIAVMKQLIRRDLMTFSMWNFCSWEWIIISSLSIRTETFYVASFSRARTSCYHVRTKKLWKKSFKLVMVAFCFKSVGKQYLNFERSFLNKIGSKTDQLIVLLGNFQLL